MGTAVSGCLSGVGEYSAIHSRQQSGRCTGYRQDSGGGHRGASGQRAGKPDCNGDSADPYFFPPDAFAAGCHAALEENLPRYGEVGQALLADLRVASGPGDRTDYDAAGEHWHHAIWKYDATYVQDTSNKRIVTVTDVIYANHDGPPPIDENSARIVRYVYKLKYEPNGNLKDFWAHKDKAYTPYSRWGFLTFFADWLDVSGDAVFAPRRIQKITGLHKGVSNYDIDLNNLLGLDENN